MNQKIILFGATGGTGRLVMERALREGHHVTAVVRDPASITLKHDHLQIVHGDVFQLHTFENAIQGKDVVVSCLGVQTRDQTTVYSQGVSNIIHAMNKYGVKRIICLSAGAVIIPPKGSLMTKFFVKNVLQKIFVHLYADMLIMEKIVTSTKLDYTIIRAPWLRNIKKRGHYRMTINEHLSKPSKISRADLADYIIGHLSNEKTYKAMVEISY